MMKKNILSGIIILSALLLGIYPVTYFIPGLNRGAFLVTKSTLNDVLWIYGFKIHIVSAGIALLIGWIQFVNYIKTKVPVIHRLIGYTFFIAVFIGGFSGLFLSFYSNYILSKIGFVFLSILWLTTSFFSLLYIKKKQYKLHYNWALRVYAITFTSVTFRIVFVLLLRILNNYKIAYTTSSWLCWIINLFIAELIIQNTFFKSKNILKSEIYSKTNLSKTRF